MPTTTELGRASASISCPKIIRVQGDRVWVGSTGGDDSGWVDLKDVLPLSEAIVVLRSGHTAECFGTGTRTLRRAEVKHALNQSESATADYTRAIELHPTEAFLYLRRGRHLMTRKICDGAMRDFAQAIRFAPTSVRQDYNLTAELYSLQSGVYASCPDGAFRDGRRAVEMAAQAVSPVFLTPDASDNSCRCLRERQRFLQRRPVSTTSAQLFTVSLWVPRQRPNVSCAITVSRLRCSPPVADESLQKARLACKNEPTLVTV